MNLIAKVPYAHIDDRDASFVLYDVRRGDKWHNEFVVWTESSTGDRYWGHYFIYDDNPESKEAVYQEALAYFLKRVNDKHEFTYIGAL